MVVKASKGDYHLHDIMVKLALSDFLTSMIS